MARPTFPPRLLITLGLVAVAVTAVALLLRPSRPVSDALARREAALELLGAEIARHHPGTDVLVLSNPFAREAGARDAKVLFEQAALRGLRRGLGTSARVIPVWPEIPREIAAAPHSVALPPNARTPLSFMIRGESVDALAQAHPEARVVVSLIGLPAGVESLRLWRDPNPRAFALLDPDLRVLGEPARAVEAFQRGQLLAIVLDDAPASAMQLITRTNILQALEQQPASLGY